MLNMQINSSLSVNSLSNRAHLASHPLAKKLFEIMLQKQTNLAVACDVLSQEELLYWADLLGPFICVLKTHIDILEDFTFDCTFKLRALADKHGFLLFEDRKFADIGQTSIYQYAGGIYRIADWADLINAHIVPGPGIIEGLKEAGASRGRGLLLLAEMSSKGSLAKGDYTEEAVRLGQEHADFVCGFISLRKLSSDPGMIHFTPGVKLESGKDNLGQQYRSLEEILIQNQSDVVIIGRDIMKAKNPLAVAALYQKRAWGVCKYSP